MNEVSLLKDLRTLMHTVQSGLHPPGSTARATEHDAEHAAALWVLTTAIITFCEDIGLMESTVLTRRTSLVDAPGSDPLDVIEQAIAEVIETRPLLGEVFSTGAALRREYRPGRAAARRLVEFWRDQKRTPLRQDTPASPYQGAEPDTSLFGLLYQELPESARKAYALLTTPDFVIDLVLDRTLGPAFTEVGSVTDHGFRYIDPACGSGGFLLGAFRRVLARIRSEQPDLPQDEAVTLALSSVHGSDHSPVAVMVSRFRLAIAALHHAGSTTLEGRWHVLVVEADSLLEGAGAPGGPALLLPRAGDLPLVNATTRADVLTRSSYDAVAGNPPYITPKNKARATAYREAYESAQSGAFALTSPFTECAFALAHRRGRVGLLMANSFTKRDFGKPLVEDFLPTVKVDDIIDTSGAYIPGHGAPTLILTGSTQTPTPDDFVTVVSAKRGEPFAPDDPAQGKVWTSIKNRLDKVPGEDTWTASQERPLRDFWHHPWRLGTSDVETVFRSLRAGTPLSDHVHRIGYIASTGSDELFSASSASMRRWGVESSATIDLVTGSEVRDWQIHGGSKAFFPRTRQDRAELVDLDDLPGHRRRLWPYRNALTDRARIDPRKWYDWHQLTINRDVSPWSIIFPWVATHTHFALNRKNNAPLNSAPVIEFPPTVTEDQILGILGLLNSSTVCFWMKQVSSKKGNPRGDQLRSGDSWEAIYEFTSTRMRDLPVPSLTEVELPRELDALAQKMMRLRTEVADPEILPTGERISALGEKWHATLRRMVLLQEELDWRIYEAYGVLPRGTLPQVPLDALPEGIAPGQRAFEFVLAQDLEEGSEQSDWFERNAIDRFTTPPDSWPPAYRHVVEKRIEALRRDPSLHVLERPDYKHRWATPPWESVWRPAVVTWILDRCERRELWYTQNEDGLDRPVVRTLSDLVTMSEGDPDVTAAVEVYSPGSTLRDLLPELLQREHVPFLAALRFRPTGLRKHRMWNRLWDVRWSWENSSSGSESNALAPSDEKLPPKFTSADFLRKSYWANRGKFDMPHERFTSYSSTTAAGLSATSMLGWAGWDAHERAQALADVIERHLAPPQAAMETMVPLLAGLAEILPWADRVGAGIGPRGTGGDTHELRKRFAGYMGRLELTEEQLTAWAPPAPRRGRPPKRVES